MLVKLLFNWYSHSEWLLILKTPWRPVSVTGYGYGIGSRVARRMDASVRV